MVECCEGDYDGWGSSLRRQAISTILGASNRRDFAFSLCAVRQTLLPSCQRESMSLLTALHSTFVGFTAASASGVRATLPLAIMAFAKHLGLVDLAPGTLFRQPTTTEPAHTAVAGSRRLHRALCL